MAINKSLIEDPFLLVYDSRSGSTFLSNLLVKSAPIAIAPESDFISAIIQNYRQKIITDKQDLENILEITFSDQKFSDWNLDCDEIYKYIQLNSPTSIRDFILLICTLYKEKKFPDSEVFGLKKSTYLKLHRTINKLFPQSKFISIVRDGRAVFNSKKNSIYSVTGKPFETNPYSAALEWSKILKLIREVDQNYPGRMAIVQYEQMIQEPEATVKTLCQFLGIKSSETNNQYSIPDRYGKDLHQNIHKEPLVDRIEAWQQDLSDREILAFEVVSHQDLLLESYELLHSRVVVTMLGLFWKIFLSVKVCLKEFLIWTGIKQY
ncbi:MAG: sulfotransferase [Okeania sp. SIO3H1]|uniref:sulfotransferase family protein n=1 Tax=Okeania sp. SIO1I7 TaxID=2607772 RepID=UPI0013CAEF34|nr:sulfotransferase [Okeania sp. SIO1I7]NEN90424.1 sulfotransferase [Okeania sp. SIO3H1]NET29672.1 sulfotransferase [Okeania sp. SIO1I7]